MTYIRNSVIQRSLSSSETRTPPIHWSLFLPEVLSNPGVSTLTTISFCRLACQWILTCSFLCVDAEASNLAVCISFTHGFIAFLAPLNAMPSWEHFTIYSFNYWELLWLAPILGRWKWGFNRYLCAGFYEVFFFKKFNAFDTWESNWQLIWEKCLTLKTKWVVFPTGICILHSHGSESPSLWYLASS